jgi:hypothetical protein
MGSWILGAVMGLVALFGLFLASRAHDGTFYYFGLAVFAFAVLFIYGMIVRATGRPVARHDDFGPPAEP